MGLSLRLVRTDDIRRQKKVSKIVYITKGSVPELGEALDTPRSYRLIADEDRIILCGHDERGAAQVSYYLEDLMNMKRAPIVKKRRDQKTLFSPRMIHSGYGLDNFPMPI